MHGPGEPTLDELAKRAAAGDRDALDDLLRRIRPDVLRRCGSLLMYGADAEDACQDAMMRVASKIGSFQGRSAFTTWLYPVVVNCTRETYRSMRKRADQLPAAALDAVPNPRTTSVIAGARIDLLDALERLERNHPEQVAAFVLRDLADLPYDDISAQLSLPLSTVRHYIHEARKFLRTRLTR